MSCESGLFELRAALSTGLSVGLLLLNPHIESKTSFKAAEKCFCLSLAEPLTTFPKHFVARVVVSFEASFIFPLSSCVFLFHTNHFFFFFSSVSWNFNQLFKSIHSVLYSHLIIHGVSENENIQDRKTTKALSSISTSRSLVKSCSNTKNALKHHQMVY